MCCELLYVPVRSHHVTPEARRKGEGLRRNGRKAPHSYSLGWWENGTGGAESWLPDPDPLRTPVPDVDRWRANLSSPVFHTTNARVDGPESVPDQKRQE